MNLNILAPLANTGYGIASKYLIKELYKEVKLSLFPRGNLYADDEAEEKLFKELIENKSDWAAPCLNIWHEFDLALRVGNGPHIAFSFFELNKLRERAKHHMLGPDKLIVASKWAAEIVKNEIGREAYVVPLGVDKRVFYPKEKQDGPYIFFNCGKFSKNKGHDFLIRCFDKAFSKSDSVELWMIPFTPLLNEKETSYWVDMYKKSKLGSKVRLLKPTRTHSEIASIIQQADAGIYPFRAEAANLPLMETLACNKPCIATNYSGPTEYLTNTNSFLLDISELERATDGKWFDGHGEWALLDYEQEDQCIEYLRHLYKERPINPNYIFDDFSWCKSSEKIFEILLDL